jgi:hypothetical protein
MRDIPVQGLVLAEITGSRYCVKYQKEIKKTWNSFLTGVRRGE